MTAHHGLGALLGILAGCGLVLAGMAFTVPRRREARRPGALARLARGADLPRLSASGIVASCVVSGLAAGTAALVVTAIPVAAAIAAVLLALAPILLLRRRVATRREALRRAWPDAIDALVSAVRAGLSLPEALADLGRSGPPPLRPAFASFGAEYRATGSAAGALDLLHARLADPVADRVITAFRMAAEFGGTDIGVVLRTLSAMLRDDAQTRGEIAARQSWTVSAARLAVAAPWLTLVLLCTRAEAAQAYATAGGALVLAIAATMSVLAYLVMMRISRLPADERMAS